MAESVMATPVLVEWAWGLWWQKATEREMPRWG
jgi:hypothetical protein